MIDTKKLIEKIQVTPNDSTLYLLEVSPVRQGCLLLMEMCYIWFQIKRAVLH